MKECIVSICLAVVFASCSFKQSEYGKHEVISSEYFGQNPPADSAVLFGAGAISSEMNDRDFAITPDGKEIFFCREVGNFTYSTIFHTEFIDGKWSRPEVFGFCTNPDYKYLEPHISTDGKRLYFVSDMPVDPDKKGNEDIWVSEKIDGKWNKPYNLGAPVNTKSKEYFPSVTNNGTIYYTHYDTLAGEEFIYRSRYKDGLYQQPEKLSVNVNIGSARYNAFVAADESYIIIPAFGMADSYGGVDYYISFRDSNDNWSKPINMGTEINSSNPREWSASVSTDGKYLFFMSARMGNNKLDKLSDESMKRFFNGPQNGNADIYWISTSVIDRLRGKIIF